MGSVMVDTMAGGTLAAEPKKLHPFFTAPKPLQQDAEASDSTTTAAEPADGPDTHQGPQEKICEMEDPASCAPKRKRRKTVEESDESWEDGKKPKRGRKKTDTQATSIMNHFSKTNGDSKTAEVSRQSAAPAENNVLREEKAVAISTPTQVTAPASQIERVTCEDVKSGQHPNNINSMGPPKKMLQLNPKTGTIGSPPRPKENKTPKQSKQPEDVTENRKASTTKAKEQSIRVIKIEYGMDDASRKRIGARIDEILNKSISPNLKREARSKMSTRDPRKTQATSPKMSEEESKKETHPFFTGKAKKAAAAAPTSTADPANAHAVAPKPAPAPTRPRIFSSTPCSPRKKRSTMSGVTLPQFGMKSLGLKTPGARLPAWPPQDMMHVRGGGDVFVPPRLPQEPLAARKSKGNTTHVAPEEMILNDFANTLQISEVLDAVRNIDTETFSPPPPELRLPQKHFESGVKLQKRVLREVKSAQHPALAQLRATLLTSLSAFDKYQCESVCWPQKYQPMSAVEILQYGKEAFLLRDWLQALKVQSVDTGEAKVKPAKPPKKKRKKNKLDSFIVDSDEEADDMDEVSDPEEDWSPDRRGVKKTVIRAGDSLARDSKTSTTRLTNTVVISGPHGCGKTSAVYAIAKELDFEVFEINSGSRRSGKDVLEKIGDMTRNHLVQHHQVDVSATANNEEEVAEDIKSGKQATMNTFFKAQVTPQPVKKKKPGDKKAVAPVRPEPKKLPSKSQKQSLILLDEVDILYEEDKQFWNTVISLIAQSKRPFIMTCNDENLVPLQTLTLHGIFRFSAPPADLAVDRLLMIAACEGHALRRNAIEALFDARQQDLRACLMDLNYWCQIAVGDQRGGLDWFYPRWPRGCDIDEDGHVVRVISQDTYVEGMGWLAHDVVSQEADERRSEEELLHEARDFWLMDAGNWHESLDLASWATQLDVGGSQDRLKVLEKYEDFTDAMSIADLCSAMAYAMCMEEPIDCTLPEITDKGREDYTLGRQLIDAPVASTFDPLATSLPVTLKCLARKNLQTSVPCASSHKLQALDEASVISKIRQHATAASDTAPVTREDFSIAFDVLASSDKTMSSVTSSLDPSVFDGTMRNIALDVAPYVRSIVTFEAELQKQRQKLSSLVSQGGKKRMRNTRASHAALEGGSRSTTRREKWFNSDLNGILVMRTAGDSWADAVREERLGSETGSGESAWSGFRRTKGRARRVITDGGDDDETDISSDGTVHCEF